VVPGQADYIANSIFHLRKNHGSDCGRTMAANAILQIDYQQIYNWSWDYLDPIAAPSPTSKILIKD
jgi:hypothetical protein